MRPMYLSNLLLLFIKTLDELFQNCEPDSWEKYIKIYLVSAKSQWTNFCPLREVAVIGKTGK